MAAAKGPGELDTGVSTKRSVRLDSASHSGDDPAPAMSLEDMPPEQRAEVMNSLKNTPLPDNIQGVFNAARGEFYATMTKTIDSIFDDLSLLVKGLLMVNSRLQAQGPQGDGSAATEPGEAPGTRSSRANSAGTEACDRPSSTPSNRAQRRAAAAAASRKKSKK